MNASIFISGGESSRDFLDLRADARIRTADPFITSEVLYQLSYVGAAPRLAVLAIAESRVP